MKFRTLAGALGAAAVLCLPALNSPATAVPEVAAVATDPVVTITYPSSVPLVGGVAHLTYGDPLPVTVRVSGAAGVARGSVSLVMGAWNETGAKARPLDANGTALFSMPLLDAGGPRPLTVWFTPAPGSAYTAAEADGAPVLIARLPAQVSLAGPATLAYGESGEVTATVVPANGFTPVGTVNFHYHSQTSGPLRVSPDTGRATWQLPKALVGQREVKVNYRPDNVQNFATTDDGAWTINVVKDATTTTARAAYKLARKTLRVRARVVPAHGMPMLGSVQFIVTHKGLKPAKKRVRVSSNGVAVFTAPAPRKGTYKIVVQYVGQTRFQASAAPTFKKTV
ncbi:MAG: Ig-like domain-containing protein [Nocardioides sp.]|jgi:hypothetical protein